MITPHPQRKGDRLCSDTGDPARARRRGRKPIRIRDSGGTRISRPGAGDLLLQPDTIAGATGTETEARSVWTQP